MCGLRRAGGFGCRLLPQLRPAGQSHGRDLRPCGSNLNNPAYPVTGGKSKMAAGLLGIFLGSLGVHNFYLGYTGKAVAQLLLSIIGVFACGIGPIAAWIWGLVEGIQILTGNIRTDASGRPLND